MVMGMLAAVLGFVLLIMGGNDAKPTKLFMFGGSFVDNGNIDQYFNHMKNETRSWAYPYGMTYPGHPSGRYSNGRIFSDYIASYLGFKTAPVPYKIRGQTGIPDSGMNFAHGGSGVFPTKYQQPKLESQVTQFQQMIRSNSFSYKDVRSAVALVSVSGEDYYTRKEHPADNLHDYVKKVVAEIQKNVMRLGDLNLGKVAIMNMPPLGCTPRATASSSHQVCDRMDNAGAQMHNLALADLVGDLNHSASNSTTFYLLDLYAAFLDVMNGRNGTMTFMRPLVPCCEGYDMENGSCGDEDDAGEEQYKLCRYPEKVFFWDGEHPTQAGWAAIFHSLLPSLPPLLLD